MVVVFAWLMHGDMLQFVWAKLLHSSTERSAISHLHPVEANGSLFWLVNFIIPSVILTIIGISVLVWSAHGYLVAAPLSVALAFCIFRVSKAIANIGNVTSTDVTCDVEKGNGKF